MNYSIDWDGPGERDSDVCGLCGGTRSDPNPLNDPGPCPQCTAPEPKCARCGDTGWVNFAPYPHEQLEPCGCDEKPE